MLYDEDKSYSFSKGGEQKHDEGLHNWATAANHKQST
jgi:hypothetical protein